MRLNIKVSKEISNNPSIDDHLTEAQIHHSINLVEKVKMLMSEGHISPFLAKEFNKYIGRGVEFERKGA